MRPLAECDASKPRRERSIMISMMCGFESVTAHHENPFVYSNTYRISQRRAQSLRIEISNILSSNPV
jgi:hypothetical protein